MYKQPVVVNRCQTFTQIAQKIKHINQECKIIVSSVLPRKNDRLANQLIKATNQSLKQLCDTNSYCFMDITGKVLKDNVPDTSLYRDSIHLNAKGGKLFGETISCAIREELQLRPLQSSADRQQGFHTGRTSGRRPTNLTKTSTNNHYHNRNNQRNNHQNLNNFNNNSQSNNISQTMGSNWMGHQMPMMFMPMPYPPPWAQHNGGQMTNVNQ